MESAPKKIFDTIIQSISDIYTPEEATSQAYLLLEHCFGLDKKKLILNEALTIPEPRKQELDDILIRLRNHEPIQYILGSTEFFGRKYQVNPSVLIPRMETEELVQLIVKENNKISALKILDIGSGSGCIAISLQLELKADMYGCDIREDALAIAKQNAASLNAEVQFFHCDILTTTPKVSALDILVSNPPYVTDSEKQQMESNVLDFEPPTALFVSNTDPLLFYRIIADLGQGLLRAGGKLYFEINEKFGMEIKELLQSYGYLDIEIISDFQGKDRFAKASWRQ